MFGDTASSAHEKIPSKSEVVFLGECMTILKTRNKHVQSRFQKSIFKLYRCHHKNRDT